jgi:ABC-2 type transport system permease protein
MGKTILIIKREYLTRVKKRSFVIMTILGPILMASVWIVPFMLALKSTGVKTVEVLDETGIFFQQFKDTKEFRFVYIFDDIQSAKVKISASEDFGILHIPKPDGGFPVNAYLYSATKPGLSLKSYLESSLNKILENKKLLDAYGIDNEQLAAVKGNMDLVIKDIETGEDTFTELSWGLGFAGGILIYMFIFMYGAQVMRGVIEEKTNRIVEVIVSSVKPIQLMLGKIIGIALVGLTQFMLWIVLTLIFIGGFTVAYSGKIATFQSGKEITSPAGQLIPESSSGQQLQENTFSLDDQENISRFLDVFSSVNFVEIIGAFLFFFIGGYLLYASLFAAIGSAVDSEADTQQFMMPVTIPLVLSMVIGLSFVLNNPDGPVAFWLSMIPFTSPVIMMIRIPFGIGFWNEFLPSAVLLILGFLGTAWFAAKIYRTGILMYGKKVSYRELWKWVRYRG